jgi:hypothetical protein
MSIPAQKKPRCCESKTVEEKGEMKFLPTDPKKLAIPEKLSSPKRGSHRVAPKIAPKRISFQKSGAKDEDTKTGVRAACSSFSPFISAMFIVAWHTFLFQQLDVPACKANSTVFQKRKAYFPRHGWF